MSTIKVNSIQHSSGANASITLSSNTDVVFSGNVTVSNTKVLTLEGMGGNGNQANTNDVLIANGSIVVRNTVRLKDPAAPSSNTHTQVGNYGDGNFVISRWKDDKTYLSNIMVGYQNGDIVFSSTSKQYDVMTLNRNGYVTKPYQPAFQGSGRVGGDLNTGSESTFTTWVSSTAITNRGNCWNSSTGQFTCPIAGIYYVAAFFLCRSNGAHNIHLYKNGSQTGIKGRDIATAGEQNSGLIGYINCAAGDTLDIRVSNSGGDFYNDFNFIAISLYG